MAEATLIKGMQLEVCVTPQPDTLTQTEFEALVYIPVCCPQTAPSFSEEAEIVEEFCISGEAVVGIGAASGAETELVVFYQDDCQGQDVVRNAFGGNVVLAFRKIYNDSPNPATTTSTTIYARAMVTSWGDNEGSVNEFITNSYTLKLVQPPILVKPESI